jgi:hypothetical protein
MTTTQTVITVLVVLVVLAAAAVIVFTARRAALRRRFGPEYDRAVADNNGRLAAERDLRARERRHAQLELRPLGEAARQQFTTQWQAVQTQFVTDPAAAVVAGDDLVTRLMAERGYPTKGYEDQLSYLSVEHARTLEQYRDAHEIYLRGQRGEASTEELRQALVHYRAIFADLLDEAPESIVDKDPASSATKDDGRFAATDRQYGKNQPHNQPVDAAQDSSPAPQGDSTEEVRHGRR